MEKEINLIQKIHRKTCVSELKEASKLDGNETKTQLNNILEKCQCIIISILINGFKNGKRN